jgi:hypothetical protein
MAKKRTNADDVKKDIGIGTQISVNPTIAAPVAPDYQSIKRDSLANFISQAVPEVTNFVKKELQLKAKLDAEKALEFDFQKNGLNSYAEAREKGLLDVRSDPTVKLAYNEALGRAMANEVRDEIQNDFMSNFTQLEQLSPKDFSNWYQGMMANKINEKNPDLLTAVGAKGALNKVMDSHYNSLRNTHNQANFAWAKKQLGVNFESSLTQATEEIDWTDSSAIANVINDHNNDKMLNHSSYTGRNINEYTAGWLGNRLKYSQNPFEVQAIKDAMENIKAGSGSLSDTSHWKPLQNQMIEQASVRFAELNSRAYRERTLAINEEQRNITTEFQNHINSGQPASSFDWEIYKGTTTMSSYELETQRQALLRSAAFEEPLTAERRFEINNEIANIPLVELDDFIESVHSGNNKLFPNPTLAELSHIQAVTNRLITGGRVDVFTDPTFKEIERELGRLFGGVPISGGGFQFAKGSNLKDFNKAKDQLRNIWLSLYDSPDVLLGYLPEGIDTNTFNGKSINELRNVPAVASAVREKMLSQVEATFPNGKFPATTIGGMDSYDTPVAPAGEGVKVIKDGQVRVRTRTE